MHTNTILNNLTRIISRHEFSSIENHFQGPKLRSADRWSQFIALAICQIMGLNSLRSLCDALNNKAGKPSPCQCQNHRRPVQGTLADRAFL